MYVLLAFVFGLTRWKKDCFLTCNIRGLSVFDHGLLVRLRGVPVVEFIGRLIVLVFQVAVRSRMLQVVEARCGIFVVLLKSSACCNEEYAKRRMSEFLGMLNKGMA